MTAAMTPHYHIRSGSRIAWTRKPSTTGDARVYAGACGVSCRVCSRAAHRQDSQITARLGNARRKLAPDCTTDAKSIVMMEHADMP